VKEHSVKTARVTITRLTVVVTLSVAAPAAAWEDDAVCAVPLPEPAFTSVMDTAPALRDGASFAASVGLADASEPLECLPPGEVAVAAEPEIAVMSVVELGQVRASFERGEALRAAGRNADALLLLLEVERAMPRIADRIAVRRGDLLRKLGMPKEACDAYAIAERSPDRGIAARAEIGLVYCKIESGSRKAETELTALLRRYPELSERFELRLQLAYARERGGNRNGAASLLRSIDLDAPASRAAREARQALARLQEQGVKSKPFTALEQVERAERMVKEAPIEQTTAEVSRLFETPKLSAEARTRLHLLAARIAKLQGRWEVATDQARQAQKGGAAGAEAGKLISPVVVAVDADAVARAAAEKRERTIRGNRPVARVRNPQLHALLDLALDHGMRELCDAVLDAMTKRRTVFAGARFDAAMRSAGLASDDKLLALLEPLLGVPSYRISARYHYARALERQGRLDEARNEYARVAAADRGHTPYYALWAEQRLSALRSLPPQVPAAASGTAPALRGGASSEPTTISSAPAAISGASHAVMVPGGQGGTGPVAGSAGFLGVAVNGRVERPSPLASSVRAPLRVGAEDLQDLDALEELDGVALSAGPAPAPEPDVPPEQRAQRLRELLAPLALQHGEAYPWIPRALDLIAIGDYPEAADELSEAYLAWRDITGAPRLRSGLVSLLTGNAPPRRGVSGSLRAGRRALGPDARRTLASAARLLGDAGIGLRLAAQSPDTRPRAYREAVESAARKYGLDPNLLFAVMRVESIYNRRIISSAGAIGLMQIMPATGRRIAAELGVEGFDAKDLLDPHVNLEFSAWYLASLIKRFDGRLPLAIASYNGGPHNVRLWMQRSNPEIPLDAFLERIPFDQTHRYVRRVLTHYAAYRAQQKLAMTPLSVELPELGPDEVAF
jgi:soluble lytic murein transglycosylase-like protein